MDLQQWLEVFADQNMTEGDEHGGSIPWDMPEGVTGIRKEVVIEFTVELADGETATTTRPKAYKDRASH